MARINCHSAFKHYEMFHSRGGDVINIGSNNTTIFTCGGSHFGGGFWGGFGLGLGNAFGSLFSGLGGFGMGGFGFPSFGGGFGNFGGGWSNPWGGAGSSRTSDVNSKSTTTTCHCSEKKDSEPAKKNIDNAKFADLTGQLKDLQQKENVTPEEIQAVIDKVQDARDKEDGIEGVNDKKTYDNLLATLKNMKTKAEQAQAAATKPAAPVTAAPSENGAGAVESGDDDGVSDNTHTYLDGYTNYDGKTELQDGDVIKAHDTSGKTKDTVIVNGKTSKITKSTNGSHPQTIVIQDTKDITYTYKETVNGEYVYVSDQDHQEYILQKHGDKYELIQYDWHEGYGKKDWSSKE